ncbi:MAG TPA: hypothetical protein VK749_01995 [Xanthobacteraceae bacterium]|nr:hypothetical protein [Xanthobacteraceae bacterium]
MTSGSKLNSARTAAILAAALAWLVLAPSARAADPIFPIASRVGLVPPAGMVVSKGFVGFEDVAKDSAILIAAQPPAAYPEIEKSLATDALKKNGITVDNREEMQFDFGKGILVVGKQAADKTRYRKWLLIAQAKDLTALVNVQIPEQETAYPDAAVRAALATLAVRATIPDAEKLSLLPFTVGDLAGLHIENVLPGRAVMLIDTPDGVPTNNLDTRMFVAAFDGGPTENDDHGQFARMTFGQIVGIKDVQITMSEPLRIGGQSGFQTMAQAKDMKTGEDIMVAQWLRFGTGGFMQMIGMAKAGVWSTELTRLRAVRDSIQPK